MKKLLYSKYVVHGVREIPYETGYIIETTLKGERAQYYTMYGIDCDGHEMAVADFKKKADANELADELNELIAEARCMNAYARLQWNAQDVKTIRPRWSLSRCEEELGSNEKYLQERLCELGWEVLGDLLPSK